MGTNPKRTVSVQMVPHMAAVDTLGNKEPNANWAKEPNLQLSQVCPKPTFISPEHGQDNSPVTAPSTNTTTHAENTASKGGGGPVSCTVRDKPAATNGNRTKSELATGRDQQVQDLCPTGSGAGETGGDQKDSNANMKMLSTADEKGICKAAVAPALSEPKVNMQTNDCRMKGPNAAQEDGNKTVAADNSNLNNACDLQRAIPQPQRDDRSSVLALKDEHAAVPQESQEPGCVRGCSRSPVSLQEEATPEQSAGSLAAPPAAPSAAPPAAPSAAPSAAPPAAPSAAPPAAPSAAPSAAPPAAPPAAPLASPLASPPAAPLAAPLAAPPAAPPGSTTPLSKTKDAQVGFTNTSSSSTHPQKDSPPLKKPQVSSDEHQPETSQTVSSAPPQATQTTPAGGQVAEEASHTNTSAFEAQRRQRDELYKEASTMTASPPPAPPVKQRHNVKVQAVADTCSKAVATSPSLLPFAAPRRLSVGADAREAAQSLVVVYQVDGGVGLHQADVSSLPAGTDERSERLTVEAEMCPNQNAGVVFHSETLSQQQDKRLGAKPKDPGSALCNTQPVYQINIEHSHRKEPGDTGNSASKSAARNPAAEAPPLGPGALREAAGAPKPGSADSHNAAPPPAATKPSHALPTTTTAAAAATSSTSKPGPAKNKSESPKQKAKGAGKAQKKAAKTGKQKTEPEGKKKEDQKEMDIHDVVWDEQGMTWEVYGASVDPESLGFAIQSHLQCKIKEQERKLVVQTSFRKSASGADSPGPGGTKSKRRRQNIFRSMLQNVRRPNCCVRPPPSSVLE